MIFFESKSLYMALTSSCLYSSSISLVVYWIDSDEKMCVCVCVFVGLIDFSWAIIASNFSDKSTRQCRRRFG